ncbi:hypothetical protein DPMN_091541 [Dreissena polymorpha]|uniref:GIY-YIG domain-containing protein n=1 Tax=Dreissena polymorpha TaxID=45954 RepID=A0A9D4L0D5_DREPO|nr:hypothetical protein DPMN_091541 [Dreissena polymorpha]
MLETILDDIGDENVFIFDLTIEFCFTKCNTCCGEYIGETINLRKRIHTHNSHIRTEQHLCRATDHLIECGKHLCDVKERYTVFVLETERDKHVRKAKEAYYIRLFKPMMNK